MLLIITDIAGCGVGAAKSGNVSGDPLSPSCVDNLSKADTRRHFCQKFDILKFEKRCVLTILKNSESRFKNGF